jgi:hypothetical protein
MRLAGAAKTIIAQHLFGRTQAARPLEPVLGRSDDMMSPLR